MQGSTKDCADSQLRGTCQATVTTFWSRSRRGHFVLGKNEKDVQMRSQAEQFKQYVAV